MYSELLMRQPKIDVANSVLHVLSTLCYLQGISLDFHSLLLYVYMFIAMHGHALLKNHIY